MLLTHTGIAKIALDKELSLLYNLDQALSDGGVFRYGAVVAVSQLGQTYRAFRP